MTTRSTLYFLTIYIFPRIGPRFFVFDLFSLITAHFQEQHILYLPNAHTHTQLHEAPPSYTHLRTTPTPYTNSFIGIHTRTQTHIHIYVHIQFWLLDTAVLKQHTFFDIFARSTFTLFHVQSVLQLVFIPTSGCTILVGTVVLNVRTA